MGLAAGNRCRGELGFSPPARVPAHREAVVRVATFNVHGWVTPGGAPNADLVADALADCAAEVIALNEVWHPWPAVDPGVGGQGDRQSAHGAAALEGVAARLGMTYAFGQIAPAQAPGGDRLP